MCSDEFLTVNEAAVELGRSPSAVRAYARYHGLPAMRRGNQTFIRRADLGEWKARPEIASRLTAGDHIYASRKAAATA